MDANNLSTRIRRSRMSAGFQGKDLAERLGISRPYLTQIEKGLRSPSEDLLNRLAENLNVSTHWLLHGDHHNHPRLLNKDCPEKGNQNETVVHPKTPKPCQRCIELEKELHEARAVIRDQASALAAALASKPMAAAVHVCGAADGGLESKKGA